MQNLYPLFFYPIYKDYLWGGNRILKEFNRKEPPGIYAESWELSDHSDGISQISNGFLQGKSLQEVILSYPQALFNKHEILSRFPLLLKLIDANDNLSIQVHPDEKNSILYGGEAKTEAWVVLDATKDAMIYAGFNKCYSHKEINQKLATKEIIPMMNTISVEKGDVIFIPGGCLHAIGKGCLILEIQQNSNTTYRVYDWDRLDHKGLPRSLHLNKAREVLYYKDKNHPLQKPQLVEKTPTYQRWGLLSTPYFTIEKWNLQSSINWKQTEHYDIFFFSNGEGTMYWNSHAYPIKKGMTCLLPAICPEVSIDINKNLEILRFY